MERTTRPIWGTALALLLSLICGLCRPASARIIYVNKSVKGSVYDGKAWPTAFPAVYMAISQAESGDEIWVAKGDYYGGITLKRGVPVYGGFSSYETDRSQRSWKMNVTNLIADSSSTAVTSFESGADLDGFTVKNGGAGVLVGGGTATVANCVVIGNTRGVSVTATGNASVSNCTISGNLWYGCDAQRGTLHVSNSVITGNPVGVSAYNAGVATITNCTITENQGPGIVADGSSASVTNCVVAFNQTGIDGSFGSPVVLSHNDSYGNTWANYRGIVDPTGKNGSLSSDPLFVNRASGDYHLGPGSPCVDAGDDSELPSGSTDVEGRSRLNGARVDMGAYESEPALPWSITVGPTVSGGVTVLDRVAYVAGNDGNLYARSTVDGAAVAGFPVDISAAVGATVRLPSRPAVYYGKTGKAIYLTTDRGDVVRVLPDGTVAWHVRPLTGQTVSTPAVTPDGNVFVNLSTGSGPFNNYVFKLDEATGTPLSLSPFLGYTTSENIGDFSPAANSKYLYVNAGWGSKSGLTLLNQDNLAVRSSFAGGEQCLSPLLLGSDLLLASKSGKAWKVNSVTLAPDLGFGHFGVTDLGTQISAAPFSDAAGNVYIGTNDGRILKWVPGTGAFTPFYTATGKIAGLTVNRTAGILGFGTSSGSFVQVPLGNPTAATTVTPGGPISTGTVYEALTDRFIVVTDTGVLGGYPSVR